jgi:hypothetical protein
MANRSSPSDVGALYDEVNVWIHLIRNSASACLQAV